MRHFLIQPKIIKFICLERTLLAYKKLKAAFKLEAAFKRIDTTAKCFNNFDTQQLSAGVLRNVLLKISQNSEENTSAGGTENCYCKKVNLGCLTGF